MLLRGRYQYDRRYPERVAGSYLASVLMHALLAALFFAVVANSSQEGATESTAGGTLVTLETRSPVVAQVPAPAEKAAPVPHAARVAPIAHPRPVAAAHQPAPPQHRELSKIVPSAPPQASPIPQASLQPNPVPTTAVFEPNPKTELPAVPESVPTAASVVIAARIPPTTAPSPVPTSVPSAKPKPQPAAPTAPPSARPQTPAPSIATTMAPKALTAQARATAAASASPAAVAKASAPPAAKPGVASPSPKQGAAIAVTHGAAPSPGPKGLGSPGPRAGTSSNQKPGPAKAIEGAPTASPRPAAGSATSKKTPGVDLTARLRALLPHNAVNPIEGSYHPTISLNGTMEPTPPPAILAMTKYIYTERGSGGDASVKMWVTGMHREGALLICEGWMLRYPRASQPGFMSGTGAHPVAGGINVGYGNVPGGVGPPIVVAHATASCLRRWLVPFAPSAAASP